MSNVTVIDWLLDADPSIRWQVMRDLTHESADIVAAERARIATEGWGARLLALQAPDGMWGGRPWSHDWTDTFHVLELLRRHGLDPGSEAAQRAGGRVRENVTWRSPGFEPPPEDTCGQPVLRRRGRAVHQRQRRRGEAYLLERRLFRRKSSGEVVDPGWLRLSFPT